MTLQTPPANQTEAAAKDKGSVSVQEEEKGGSRVLLRSATAEGGDGGGDGGGGQPPTDEKDVGVMKRLLGVKEPQDQDLMWKVNVSFR